MTHGQIINQLILHFNYQSYLEIGVEGGDNFRSIGLSSSQKVGVDPNTPFPVEGVRNLTSDDFFASNIQKFDLIFIDGLHHEDQVSRDILNSINILNPNGTIVCHDLNPNTFEEQIVPRQSCAWTGDCWKAWVRLRAKRTDLDMRVVDTDFGCGIIRRGSQCLLEGLPPLDWQALVINRNRWLNMISIDDFNQLYPLVNPIVNHQA